MDEKDLQRLAKLIDELAEDTAAYSEEHSILRHKLTSSEEPDQYPLLKAALETTDSNWKAIKELLDLQDRGELTPEQTAQVARFVVQHIRRLQMISRILEGKTNLLEQNGEQHSDLTHAVEQINQWLGVLDDHRLSVLEEMRISRETVSKIRGVVIAGRDAGNDANHFRCLRGSYQDRVALLTYDDLAVSLAALAQNIGDL
jgi:hypothetical protein